MKKNMIFDNLPDDIIDKCYNYIYYPQSSYLLKEIKDTYIINILNKHNENSIINIFYKLLKLWHIKYAISMINEIDYEYNGIEVYINTFESEIDRKKLWKDQIYNLIGIIPEDTSSTLLYCLHKPVERCLVLEII